MNAPVWSTYRNGTKYRHIGQDEPLWIIVDLGNTDCKAMLHGHWGEEIVFPHAIRRPSEADYDTLTAAYKHRAADFQGTAIFRIAGQGYVVGRHAAQVGKGERLIGAAKYLRDHFGVLFLAALVQLYHGSHQDVRVVVLHPPRLNTENLRALYKSLNGKHSVDLPDGRKFNFNVTEIIPLEEPVASLQTFLLTTEGRTYEKSPIALEPGNEIYTVDVGGALTVFVPCLITEDRKIEVNISEAPPIRKGIQDVIETFEQELRAAFPNTLGRLPEIPLNMMHNALMTGKISIRNRSEDCAEQVANSMAVIGNPIEAQYANRYARGVTAAGIAVSGGGGGLSFNYLKDNVLEHDFVYPCETDLTRMRFGAIRGASKGLIAHLNRQKVKG